MSQYFQDKVESFYQESFFKQRYDFYAGRKIGQILKDLGYKVQECLLEDRELAFAGPATGDIVKAWSQRFERMQSLKKFLGREFDEFRSEYLSALKDSHHQSRSRVFCVVGKKS